MTPHAPTACHDCADEEIARLTRERDAALARAEAAERLLAAGPWQPAHPETDRERALLERAEAAGVKFGPWWATVGRPARDAWRKARR